jgi:hypothetical protein
MTETLRDAVVKLTSELREACEKIGEPDVMIGRTLIVLLKFIKLLDAHPAEPARETTAATPPMDTWPRIINDDGSLRLEQTQPPNSYLVVRRNSDNAEVVSTPCVTTEPKDEIIRLLTGAWVKAIHGREAEARETPPPTCAAWTGPMTLIGALLRVAYHGALVKPEGPYVLVADLHALLHTAPHPGGTRP